ncbi:MAG: bifunctional demethylmenaquinone methyltransferase/2-methoxy-6-polyprenyl-1,4-benzoquinol methylase UbiE [Bdellovibrio sp.]|nr:bifunctional demethylmenaquinone methyltransferase/2-methoxy-6-polyprenyl-1,4-benzoquinol methylase UbiE [Bdellovibrio sp.]
MQQDALTVRKRDSYQIFNDIAATYDLLNRILSFGIDRSWRKRLAKRLVEGPIQVLDLATGTADLAIAMAKSCPLATIKGIDLSKGMIDIGNKKVQKNGLSEQINLELGDGVNLNINDQSMDFITIAFGIRNFSNPLESLKQSRRVLKSGGRILILEFSWPNNRLVRRLYNFYFRHLLPWLGNLLSGHRDAYTYLNQTVEDFPYGKAFLALMQSAGFQEVSATPLTFGIATLYEGRNKHG